MAAPRAPFARPLYGPDDRRFVAPGTDVVAVKRALSRAGHLSWANFDRVYNRRAVRAVQSFQRTVGIQPTGHYGLATHEALRFTEAEAKPGEWAFDAYSVHLLRNYVRAQKRTREEEARDAIADAAAYWIARAGRISYRQMRPFPVVEPPAIPAAIDCSGFVTICYFAADAPDPNGRDYDGYGYTGTLMSHGRDVTVGEVESGDLVFYGRTPSHKASPAFPAGSPTHVAVALGGGLVASHGSEGGPYKLRIGYREDLHSVRRYPLAA